MNPDREDLELSEWFLYFNGVGLAFLEFLVTRKKTKLAKLQQEINEIKEKLAPMSKKGLYQVYTKELREIMIEEEEEQRIKKRKKHFRHIEDYKSYNIFKWQESHRDSFIKPSETESMEEGLMEDNVAILPSLECPRPSGPPPTTPGYRDYGPTTMAGGGVVGHHNKLKRRGILAMVDPSLMVRTITNRLPINV